MVSQVMIFLEPVSLIQYLDYQCELSCDLQQIHLILNVLYKCFFIAGKGHILFWDGLLWFNFFFFFGKLMRCILRNVLIKQLWRCLYFISVLWTINFEFFKSWKCTFWSLTSLKILSCVSFYNFCNLICWEILWWLEITA